MKLKFIDAHSEGAPCRAIIDGLEEVGITGKTMLEKKVFVEQNADWLRTALLQEPRGFPALNADLVVPPCDPTCDVGLVIINQRPIYPLMSGGNILCFVGSLVATGFLPMNPDGPVTTVRVDTPAGLVIAKATAENGKLKNVAVENVPSYATHLDTVITVPGLGELTVDVAYGGMFYLIVSADQLGIELTAENAADLCEIGEAIRDAAVSQIRVDNPASKGMATVDAVLISDKPKSALNHGRSAVVMPMLPGAPTHAKGVNALIDRCPCGTGTSAQVAVKVAKGELAMGEPFRQESIIDTVYEVTALRATKVGARDGIVPEIKGSVHVTAEGTIHIDADRDPLAYGFKVGDSWAGRIPV